MLKTIAAGGAVALLALPAGAQAKHHHPTPARNAAVQQCTQERAQIGVQAFRQKYGTPHAFKNCVKAHKPADKAAAEQCRDERKAIGQAAFKQKYGPKHAMRNCIEQKTATGTGSS